MSSKISEGYHRSLVELNKQFGSEMARLHAAANIAVRRLRRAVTARDVLKISPAAVDRELARISKVTQAARARPTR